MKSEVKRQKTNSYTERLTSSLSYTLHIPIQATQKAFTKSAQIAAFIGKSLMTFRSRPTAPTLEQQTTQVFQETGTHRQLPTSKRQREIASSLCSNTELPYELIRLIIVYDDPFLFHQPSHAITALVVLTPSNHLASASGDMSIRIWDPNTGECLIKLQRDLPITTMIPLPNNELACCEDRSFIHIWNTATGKQRATLSDYGYQNESINSMLALPEERLVAGGSYETQSRDCCCFNCIYTFGIIKVWDTQSGKVLQTFSFTNPITGLYPASSSDNIVLKTHVSFKASDDDEAPIFQTQMILFNLATGQIVKPIINKPESITNSISLASLLITAGNSKNIYQYNLETGDCQTYSPFWFPSLKGHPITLILLADQKIASGGWKDQKIRIIDPKTLECKQEFKIDNQVTALATLPENRIAVGSANGKIEVIDTTPEKGGKV